MASHWRGFVVLLVPALVAGIVVGIGSPSDSNLCGMVVIIMATFWVSEAISLTVTSFIPMFAFPILGLLSSVDTCMAYLTDTVAMFMGSLFLAFAIELSGLHIRLALWAVRTVGYSHQKLLFGLSFMTMFISMWITNTAATTMMVPINFAILRVLEEQGIGTVYVYKGDSRAPEDRIPADITVCYFCTASYSATIGGIGTLVGSGTNLAFKGLLESWTLGFQHHYECSSALKVCPSGAVRSQLIAIGLLSLHADTYPKAPELLTFPLFSAFCVPYMLCMNLANYFWMLFCYFGWLRPNSAAAKAAKLSPEGIAAAKRAVDQQWKDIGPLSFYEMMVIILFGAAVVMFFCRQPRVFTGWAEILTDVMNVPDLPKDPKSKYIRDSAPAMFILMFMFMLPSTLEIFKYCRGNIYSDLPNHRILSVLDWHRANKIMPWGFAFLLGGGFALSTAASKSGLSKKLGEMLSGLRVLPPSIVILVLILFTVFVTNFASNVATANIVCPVAMELARVIKMNPLWLCVVCGLSASYCYMLPVGTPGNLIVQSATNMPTSKMIVAGSGTTLSTIILSWVFMTTYIKLIWDLDGVPDWAK